MYLITGTTHNRACPPVCVQARYAQLSKHGTISFYLSIHPIGLVDNAGQYASKKPLEELTIAIAVAVKHK
jgi:hypothetical protein